MHLVSRKVPDEGPLGAEMSYDKIIIIKFKLTAKQCSFHHGKLGQLVLYMNFCVCFVL